MDRKYLILYTLLFFAILAIVFGIYATNKALREVSREEAKPRTEEHLSGRQAIQASFSHEKLPLKIRKEETQQATDLEFSLKEIPDNYVQEKDIKEMEGLEYKEAVSLGDKRLNKQPSLQGLKELKAKGVIIY